MKFQKTALSTMLLTVAVAMSGNVQAGDQFMAANGQSQTFLPRLSFRTKIRAPTTS